MTRVRGCKSEKLTVYKIWYVLLQRVSLGSKVRIFCFNISANPVMEPWKIIGTDDPNYCNLL